MLQAVAVLLAPGAFVVAWIVALEVVPDLIRSLVGFFQDRA